MKIEQRTWSKEGGWKDFGEKLAKADLVLAFGATSLLKDESFVKEMRALHPEAKFVACSTAGEIMGETVSDDSISYTAIKFDSTTVACVADDIASPDQSHDVGAKLAKALPKEHLAHVLVFSDGLKVNGTALVRGISGELDGSRVAVTGGLVGDGPNFKETVLGCDEQPRSGRIILVGFYGDKLKVGYGSLGGWDPFGPTRTITRSKNNVLYELDGKPALALYKDYLGEKAKELPSSGLLFPLSLTIDEPEKGPIEVVRTVLAVNEEEQSLTFAGDMPEGVKAKLMKANFDRLIDGAGGAASVSLGELKGEKADLAILISCIGRKLVLKERIEEEIEAVRSFIGDHAAIAGFYSYGEICPTSPTEKQCQLHNQTMTITVFREE